MLYALSFCKYSNENSLPPKWNVHALSGDIVLTYVINISDIASKMTELIVRLGLISIFSYNRPYSQINDMLIYQCICTLFLAFMIRLIKC